MICYPAVIEYDRADDAYNVSFPDLPGCLTFGRTLDEAKENAREALSAYLESIDSRKLKVPASSEIVATTCFRSSRKRAWDSRSGSSEAGRHAGCHIRRGQAARHRFKSDAEDVVKLAGLQSPPGSHRVGHSSGPDRRPGLVASLRSRRSAAPQKEQRAPSGWDLRGKGVHSRPDEHGTTALSWLPAAPARAVSQEWAGGVRRA